MHYFPDTIAQSTPIWLHSCSEIFNYPLERVEIDHTPIDVILVDENGSRLGRPYLVLAIDKYSRQVLGFSIGVSNGVGWPEVMQCIKHIMSDKSYVKEIYPFIENEWIAFGLPKTIVIDNGLEFKNNAMKDASYQLGFVLQFCPPKVPQWKGSIERFFGTANSGLFHNMPGTTRSNPTKLGDDENPSDLACLTFSTFIAIVHKWIIDVYSQDLNKGAGGKPALIWKKAIEEYPISLPNNISETAILLGRTAHRKISRRGIELDTLHYNNSELNKVLLQFTQENKGSLMIFDRFANLKYRYGNRHFWCRGYYVDTVGRNKNAIAKYIQNQLQEDQLAEQISLKEYIDPFTGEQDKKSK